MAEKETLIHHAKDLGFDFADALDLSSCKHTKTFATFDKKLIKQAKKIAISLLSPHEFK